MDDLKLGALMQESRTIAAAENVIFPLIKLKIEQRVNAMVSRFNGGETSFISDAAYISGLKMLEQELRNLQRKGNAADYELNKDQIK